MYVHKAIKHEQRVNTSFGHFDPKEAAFSPSGKYIREVMNLIQNHNIMFTEDYV